MDTITTKGIRMDKLDNLTDAVQQLDEIIDRYSAVSIQDKYIRNLKDAINGFFPDLCCRMLFISNNTDKEFFGIRIVRNLNISYMLSCKDIRDCKVYTEYSLDIDSKLFGFKLSARQIAAYIIYDIYKIVSHEAQESVMACLDAITTGRREVFDRKTMDNTGTEYILKIAIHDYLYRTFSIFTRREDELIRVPELLTLYELDSEFIEGLERLFKASNAGNRLDVIPSLALNWAVSVIFRWVPRASDIMDTLNAMIATTGSVLYQNNIKSTLRILFDQSRIAMKRAAIGEASLFSRMRKNGIKSLENDVFEYEMRVKNIDDENSAIFLMRQINSRMSIIQDYLDEEEKMSDSERRRWQNLADRYEKLRQKMVAKPIYSRKMYGLFVDYNALMQPGPENLMTMNTVY